MKARHLIDALQTVDGETEVYFSSCCYPTTKHIFIDTDEDGGLVIGGYRGSYVAGDPEFLSDEVKP